MAVQGKVVLSLLAPSMPRGGLRCLQLWPVAQCRSERHLKLRLAAFTDCMAVLRQPDTTALRVVRMTALLAIWQFVAGSKFGRWIAIAAGALLAAGLWLLRHDAGVRRAERARQAEADRKRAKQKEQAIDQALRDADGADPLEWLRERGRVRPDGD